MFVSFMPNLYDIVLIPFSFTDLSSAKLRPALVVANPYGENIIVVFISSQKSNKSTDVQIVATKQNGLKKDSVIKCAKIATLDQGMFVGKLGELDTKYQKTVRKILARLFHITS